MFTTENEYLYWGVWFVNFRDILSLYWTSLILSLKLLLLNFKSPADSYVCRSNIWLKAFQESSGLLRLYKFQQMCESAGLVSGLRYFVITLQTWESAGLFKLRFGSIMVSNAFKIANTIPILSPTNLINKAVSKL